MMNPAAASRAVLLFLAVFLTGCLQFTGSSLEEEKDPHYLEGMRRVNGMNYDGAIQSFQKALQTNPKNSAAHLQLALIYNDEKKDPVAALYHFERHLESRPDSPMAEVVNQRILSCKRELAQNVALVVAPAAVQQEMARLARANEALLKQVARLEEQLAVKPRVVTTIVTMAQSPALTHAAARTRPEPEPEPERRVEPLRSPRHASQVSESAGGWVPRTITPANGSAPSRASRTTRHTLRKGETIASLSRRYDVTIADIVAANPGMNPDKVYAGETVLIPSR